MIRAPTTPSGDGQSHADVLAPTVGEVVNERSTRHGPAVER